MPPGHTVTTSYLLGNLHCPSCVSHIKSLLYESYQATVLWVSPNLVTSVVTVEHLDAYKPSVSTMEATLRDSGYDVCGVHTTSVLADDSPTEAPVEQGETSRDGARQTGGFASGWFRSWRKGDSASSTGAVVTEAHLQNCAACRDSNYPFPLGGDATLDDHKTCTTEKPLINSGRVGQGDGSLNSVTVTTEQNDQTTWRATLSIGGMTCASCVNAVTRELKKQPWIIKATVNLVQNSAAVEFVEPGNGGEIAGIIEDLGYDASIDKVVNLNEEQATAEREVQIIVDGIFCSRCPERISETLRSFGTQRLSILEEASLKKPILRLKYTPNAPHFTIRHLLKAISAADPSLKASIYQPPTLEERSKAIRVKHQKGLLRRGILTLIIAIPTFVLGIVYMSLVPHSDPIKMYLMQPWTSGISRLEVILCLLSTPVYFFAADTFHVRAIKELRTMWRPSSRVPVLSRFYRFGSMNLLMSLGTSIAYISSIAQMISAAAKNEKLPQDSIYFDSVVFLTLFLLAGRLIEAYSKSKTGNAVESLMKLRPDTALLVGKASNGEGATVAIPLDQLEVGDVIRITHGSSPPADGIILSGEGDFDESSLTGESRLVKKSKGDEVFAGTMNKAGAVQVRVTGTQGKSMLDQIVQVVREGQTKRAPIEQIADTMTSYFVPVITLVAILTWLVWIIIGYAGGIHRTESETSGGWVVFALRFAISVFVVACPCGLALAAPTAIFVGGGLAAKHGVLVKGGGEAFEKAHKINCVVFDKTGTITVGGEPRITESLIFPDGRVDEVDAQTLLSILKVVEEDSSHPIAKAIVAFCGTDRLDFTTECVEELPGKGMRATCAREGQPAVEVIVGNEHLLRDFSIHVSQRVSASLDAWKTQGKSVALVAVKPTMARSWTLAAGLAISDPIREEAASVIQALQSRGTQVWMLSGDNEVTAKAVAAQVGIPSANVLAEVLPSDKAAKIKYLQSTLRANEGNGREDVTRRAMVAMVGDGINDSPALTTADVGIAIGSGSDVAISSADFILATSNLVAVLTLLDLSRVVFRRIKLNFGWAVIYNILAVPVAAGCLYPIVTPGGEHVTLDPVWAALAMALSSISVVLSSLSLRSGIPGLGFRARRDIS